MNRNLNTLVEIAKKPTKNIIGLMSGTSLDGLDVAHCEFSGSGRQTKFKVLNFETLSYPNYLKKDLKSVVSKRNVDIQLVSLLNAFIGTFFGETVLECLKHWHVDPSSIDVIASHGHSIFHAPRSFHGIKRYPNATFQIGDGDHIAVKTGICTISDFRQKHIAMGGEGAPLAAYGDHLMFTDTYDDRIMLNIGGIGNFTFLPAEESGKEFFSTDTGPGNILMDHFIQSNFPGEYYDKDAGIAYKGTVNAKLLKALLNHPFFSLPIPKTTGPELFNLSYLQGAIAESGEKHLSIEDIMATLSRFSAESIVQTIRKSIPQGSRKTQLYLSGGGARNPLLRAHIETLLKDYMVMDTSELGLDPDAKEAVLFALLANEVVSDYHDNRTFTMGKISLPF